MQSFTFGSNEGFDAVQEAMLQYITKPLLPNSKTSRDAFHTSFNLNDATQLLNVFEFVMTQAPQIINEALSHSGSDFSQTQAMLDWVEQYYRDIAGTVGVELI